MFRKISFVFILFTIITLFACSSESTNKFVDNANCSSVPAENTYTKTIKPILNASCAIAGCHDAVTKAEGVVLDTYSGAKSTFGSGKGLCSIYQDGCKPMPQGSDKFSTEVLNLFSCWVKNNMPQ